MNSLLSVVIPTLNEEYFLTKLLSDLVQQTDKDFEVVIVDGLSEDKTKQISVNFNKALQIRFYSVEKRNVSFQRNFGGKMAKGSFILFLDADARVTLTFIEKIRSHIREDGAKLFIPRLFSETNSLLEKSLLEFTNLFVLISNHIKNPISAGGSMFVDKKMFLSLSGFDETFYLNEDHNLVKRIYKSGASVKVVRDVSVGFSMRRMKKEGKIRFIYEIITSYIHFCRGGNPSKKLYAYKMGGHYYDKKLPKY